MGGPPPATMPNPRLAELHAARTSIEHIIPTLDDRFTAAITAMRGGAWTTSSGSASDVFFAALTANATRATGAGTGSLDTVQAAIANCPATVATPHSPPRNGPL